MAAKLDGGAYLTSFVDAILEKLSPILEEDDSFLERNFLLGRLEKTLYEAGPVLDDAEQKQFTNKKVKKWLLDLQDALYKADDLVDELSTKAAIPTTLRDPGISSSCSSLVDSYIEGSGDMEKIVGTLESVVAKKNHHRLKECAKVDMSSWRTPSTSLVVSSDIFGRDEDKEKIIKLLISEHENVVQHDTKTRHLSYDVNDNNSVPKMLEACESSSHVRTLFQIKADLYGEHKEGIDPCRLLEQLKRLRVLSFTSFKIDILPDSIGGLIHLRYLDLSGTPIVTLPESMSNLYNLQTLKLRRCRGLKKLPSNMQNLVNLRHLDIKGTDLKEMPKNMSKLKDLQFLSFYIVGKHEENGLGELGELTHLHGSLRIEKLENVKNSGEASNARMDEKIHLNALYLEWSWSLFEESEVCEKDVLEKLRPHKDLKELSIEGYRSTMFPDWVGQSSYHNMTELKLIGCRNCWVLPSLGQLPSLERLVIEEFDKVKKIGGSFYKGDATHQHQETPFRSLKYLSFSHMDWWEEWESYECDDDDDAPFPKLETLEIWHCPKLRGDLPTFLPSLKELYIRGCEELGCYLPRAPILRSLRIDGKQEARMRELPLSMLRTLWVNGEQQVEYVFEAMTHTQPTSLIHLHISECSSAISFPGDSLPPSLQQLRINNCKNVEFPMQNQQHESLTSLTIKNSCDSLTSLPAFPSLLSLRIERCENLTSLELSQSQSLRYLWIAECPKLKNIIRLPASLIRLFIIKCPLLGEGIERKDPHIWPSISHIPGIYFLCTNSLLVEYMDKELCIYFNFVVSGRNFNLEWTTLRLLLLHHPLTHPNLRPFITFLGVALACLLAHGPCWFARDESEQTWTKPN
ncbi:hypothetical protein Ahy_A02g005015 isoform B [Arachis hypogaea]|uniref:Uncharacterized protein n=1 Tax=Arachis hypogaea TaxID=3818 RepID=A0A445E5H0_ARAHY|nr:hypothetical protein Ahy_A02g005015 isoform B [Arachis hypogaea]